MPMMNWLTTGNESCAGCCAIRRRGKENMDIDWRFHRGDVVKLRIFNDPSIEPRDGASDPSARPAISRADAATA